MNTSKRLARLEHLLQQIEHGKDVAKRDLKSALTDAEWIEYERHKAAELENRNQEPPTELEKYLDLKKQADLARARANRHYHRKTGSKNPGISKKMYESQDALVERALEHLKELLASKREMVAWLTVDGPFDSLDAAIDARVMPQLITSRTASCSMRSPDGQWSIRQLKQGAIESAIFSLTFVPTDEPVSIPTLGVKKRKLDFSKFKV